MAVLQMQHIYICGLKKERKQILEQLQRSGVVEISEMKQDNNVFIKQDVTSAVSALKKNVATAKEAILILDAYTQKKSSMLAVLNGRKVITGKAYDDFYKKHDYITRISNRICSIPKQIAEQKAEILKLKAQKEILSPWVLLDIPLNYKGTKSTSVFLGTLPNSWSYDEIYSILAEFMPVDVKIISSSREQTCIFVLCEKQKSDEVYNSLRSAGFSYVSSLSDIVPAAGIKEIDDQIETAEKEISDLGKEIKSYDKNRDDIMFLYDFETMRSDKYEVINLMLQSRNTFVISGYVADRDKNLAESALTGKYEVAVEFEQPSEDEDTPILLKNNSFARPLEKTIESFSLPGKGEIDPTSAVSLFYYMLFGLMLSDAVYGAVIAFACAAGLIFYRRNLEDSVRNTLKMYLFCGIATIFWGVMFGSYLGDIVDVVSKTFLGKTVSIPPLWFFPIKDPMRMLVFCMIIGITHLFFGLGMKLVQCIRQKNYKAIIYDVFFWYMLLIGSILKLLSMKMFTNILGLSSPLSASVGNVGGIVAVIAALGIIMTNGRESKNPFKRFLKGLYALYGITGYLSDILSYSRLLALGLATGVICSVVNQMAGMLGGSFKGPIGVILFIIVCILGHTLNIAISALGAYVHTTRLQYVEFFGKFYQGGGHKFSPFGVETKYYKIMEE